MTKIQIFINAFRRFLKVFFLEGRYNYAVKKSIQAFEQKKYYKRVFIILDANDRLVVVDRKAFRAQKNFKTLDRKLVMGDLRKNSIFYYPAYDTDDDYPAIMESKKKRYMDYFLGE